MAYRWEDLQANRLEVEWGENLHGTRTRRARTMRPFGRATERGGNGWLSVALVAVSTLAAIGMASLVALTLVRAPAARRDNGNPSSAVDLNPLQPISEEEATVTATPSPTDEPSGWPSARPTRRPATSRPTTAGPTDPPIAAESRMPSLLGSAPPSITPSDRPSAFPSTFPSTSPSGVPRAPPAPDEPVRCIDQPGFFHNHAGDKVSCDWFRTVGTYNFEKNCENTAVGEACAFTCREYNGCIPVSDPPSREPTVFPTSLAPTAGPTGRPPKSITLEATGDASVKEANPSANFGSASWLKIDTKPPPLPQDAPGGDGDYGAFHVMLRFDVSKHNAARPVKSAVLRLKAAKGCSSGGYLQRTASPHWDESTVTWESAPEGDGTEIGRLGQVKSGFWYSFDVTSALGQPGHKTLSLRLYPAGSDECLFVSKDNGSGGGPELHIVYDDMRMFAEAKYETSRGASGDQKFRKSRGTSRGSRD